MQYFATISDVLYDAYRKLRRMNFYLCLFIEAIIAVLFVQGTHCKYIQGES